MGRYVLRPRCTSKLFWNQQDAKRERGRGEVGDISTLTLPKDYFRTCSNMLGWIIQQDCWAPALCTCTASIKHLIHAFTSSRWKCTLGHGADKKETRERAADYCPGERRKQRRRRQNKCNARWLTWVLSRGLWIIDDLPKWITRRSTCCAFPGTK